MKNLDEMEKLAEYAQTHGVDCINDYGESCGAYAISPIYAYINFPNGYRASILKKEESIDNLTFEYIDVAIFDWNGYLDLDILYGICEDNHIPCKNEEELIGILETIRNLYLE